MRAFVLLFIPIIFASDVLNNLTNEDKLKTVNNKPSLRIFNVIRFPVSFLFKLNLCEIFWIKKIKSIFLIE